MAGAGDKLELGANFLGEFFGIFFVDDAVGLAGEEKCVFLEWKVSDGILGGKLRGAENFASAWNLVTATLVRDGEGFFEESGIVWNEKEASCNIISDETGRASRDWDEWGDETTGAGGDWREKDELVVNETWLGVSDGGSDNRAHGMPNENWALDMMFLDKIINETDVGFGRIGVNRGTAEGWNSWSMNIITGSAEDISYLGEAERRATETME